MKKLEIKIYLGTWCGDTKNYFPKFMKLMKHYGVNGDQIELIALSSYPKPYKQSPGRSETKDGIHRVPTFIFYQDNHEIGRIVERPVTDLESDVAQLYLNYPVRHNYYGLTMMQKLLEEQVPEDDQSRVTIARKLVRNIGKSSELNTFGYVLLGRNEMNKAVAVFRINTLLFPRIPNS